MTPGNGAPSTRTVAIVLAAGGGSRFEADHHKLLARLPATAHRPAETVLARTLAAVAPLAAATDRAPAGVVIDRLVVVTGAASVDDVLADVRAEFELGDRLEVAHNPRWSDGQATSIQAGLAAAEAIDADVAVIGLADQPDVTAATWAAVATAAVSADGLPITVATYRGKPRNPVALWREIWPELPTDGDRGARDLIRLMPQRVAQVPSAGSPADIDTVEDLRRWQNI